MIETRDFIHSKYLDGFPPLQYILPMDFWQGDFTLDRDWSTHYLECLMTYDHLTYELGNKRLHYVKLLSSGWFPFGENLFLTCNFYSLQSKSQREEI